MQVGRELARDLLLGPVAVLGVAPEPLAQETLQSAAGRPGAAAGPGGCDLVVEAQLREVRALEPLRGPRRPPRADLPGQAARRGELEPGQGVRARRLLEVREQVALSRIEIDQARLLCLQTAWLIDQHGNRAARDAVAAIKVVAARLQTAVTNRAMQVHGAMGLTPDTPLAALWSWGRAMRFLDGPDEVHLRTVARDELGKARDQRGHTAAYFTL